MPFQIPSEYEPLLARVEKPGRYVGGEIHSVVKDPARGLRASIALAFPDLYEIGMSYHGFRILYERINAVEGFAAERVFTPWPDYAEALRRARLPLTTLETYRPLRDLDVVGFTLQHELGFTNVLETLDLGGVPIRGADRTSPFPLVIAGGEGAHSPEPMADFIDAFVVGDGEEAALEILDLVARAKEEGVDRPTLLRRLATVEGVYVPSLYEVRYRPDGAVESIRPAADGVPETVRPRVFDLGRDAGPVRPVVPLIRSVQDRTVIEIRRGCVNGCRFCQAGMIARPVRERSVEQIVEIARAGLASTGDSEISLLSLSTADYSEILPLARTLNAELGPRRISISLPSLRIDAFDVALAAEISSVRKSGFTFAPEAGSERLRRIVNKPLDEAEFLDIVGEVLRAGWRTLKMYFMIGLPGETDEDLGGIARIVREALGRAKSLGVRGVKINVTLSPFVPKAHTPFQWEGQTPPDELRRRMNLVRDRLPPKVVAVKTSPLEGSVLEAAMARGDRRLGAVVERAWRDGARFDGWKEHFRFDRWRAAFEACGLDPAFYTERRRGNDEVFPYDVVLAPPGRRFLAFQRDLARRGEVTPDCQNHPCAQCDACAKPKEHRLARDGSPESESGSQEVSEPAAPPQGESSAPEFPVMRARLRFSKGGALRFVSHLDLAETIQRLIRRSRTPVAYSHGFNPQPQISLSPPLPLGFEALGELADVLLVERIDLKAWLRDLRAMPVAGLEWTGVEEVPLKTPSIQQAIERYDYRIDWRGWGDEPPALPLDRAEVESRIAAFLASAEWPIEILRKGSAQRRDARAFVEQFRTVEPARGCAVGLEMRIRSENGTTLSPLAILESLFDAGGRGAGDRGPGGSGPGDLRSSRGLILHVARLPIEIE
ncbi:TIGR03960 family B12-binding radical SAM protein [Candidatus Sumerlaeota bacterium]|nr:TIGR03960 family B12-binding radical SAM protein [Candidatus Sumerlaeota bacterium]